MKKDKRLLLKKTVINSEWDNKEIEVINLLACKNSYFHIEELPELIEFLQEIVKNNKNG